MTKKLGIEHLRLAQRSPIWDCCGEAFGGFELQGEDLSYGLFDHSDFESIQFENCDFSNASFEKVEFKYILFSDCDFTNTNFDSASFEECSFLNCTMYQSSFQHANVVNCTYSDCLGGMDFSQAEVSGGVFYENAMEGSSFFGSSLSHVTFGKCDLKDLLLSHATEFETVAITDCDITEVYFVMARGSENIIFTACKYAPYSTNFKPARLKRNLPLCLPAVGQTSSGRKTSFLDWTAHLYCSSPEEFESIS
jgi:uncharacterized protein YjbI with pentapeptide repeats